MEFSADLASTAPVQRVSVQDSEMAREWGFSDWGWSALSDAERADLRSRIVYAPGFKAEGK